MDLKGQVKYSLGRDIYLSVCDYNGKPKIAIAKYNVFQSKYDTEPRLIPTTTGISLDLAQFEELVKHGPGIVKTAQNLQMECNQDIVKQRLSKPVSIQRDPDQI